MKRKSKSILKCVMTFVLIVAMVLGAVPLPQFTMVALADNINVTTADNFGTLTDGKYTLVNGNTYTLTDNVNTAGYIYVPSGVTATIDLNGHTIDRGLTSEMTNGSVIIVDGTLTIKDSGTGGKVQGGYAADEGSCVRVQAGATFTLQSGTLIGRVQDYDYTVFIENNSNFTMTGGKITEGMNGIFVNGNVTISGGEISGNENIGVRVEVGKFSVYGKPVIKNNTRANVRLSGGYINVVGALNEGANIGIKPEIPTDNAPVTVTSGYGTYNSAAPDTYFTLDNNGQIQTGEDDYMTVVLGWNEDRTELAVGTAMRTVAFDMNGHGDAIEAISLLSGYKLMKPEPTADDWFFVGWFADDACTSQWDFDNAVTSNMTLHALWTQNGIYSFTLPENMVIVSKTNAPVGGKYPVGTVIKFKLSSADYVVDGDVSDGTNTLTPDGDGIYTVTMSDADITITATVKKAVEANKELSGSDSYTAQNGDVLTGTTSGTVTIADNAKITLSDVTITGGIVCAGTAEITLVGTNSVTGAYEKAGIQVGGSGTTLTIKGNGSLTANGSYDSAGIGLSCAWKVDAMGGDIVIEGGNITATGNDMGAGIGTGVSYGNGTDYTATLGNITIKGGTVRAIGGTNNGNGIGKGHAYSSGHAVVGTITIYDGIDMVDASSISESVTYMHNETDVTANASNYFTITEDGNRRIIAPKDDTDYTITIANGIEHGSLTGAATAKYMEKVTITATPALGYIFSRLVVKDADNNDVATTGNTFLMPKGDVTVSAVFEQGTHGMTEFAWGYFGPDGFVTEATIYDGVTTVELQQGQSYQILKYDNEYRYKKFLLDNDTYNVTIPYSSGTGTFLESGNCTNFRVDYNSESGYYDITMTDAGNGKWSVSILKSVVKMDDIPDQTYTGSEITPEPLVMADSLSLNKGTDYEYSYENNTNVGTAKVTVTFKGDYASLGSVEKKFTITKATPTVTAPTANTLTYNGNEQELVTAGSTDFGTVLYSLDGKTYSESIPKAKDAGKYTVYYKVEGSNNWNEVEPQTIEATICKADIHPTLSIQDKTYDGNEITFTIGDNPGGGVVTSFSWEKENSDHTWSSVSDTPKDAGKYRGKAVIGETDNYNGATTNTVEFIISKAKAKTLDEVSVSRVYTQTEVSASVSKTMPGDAGSLTYAKGTESKTGSVTVSDWNVDSSGNVTATLSGGKVGDTITLPVTIGSTNYADSTVNVVITLTAKDDAGVSIEGIPPTDIEKIEYGDTFAPSGLLKNPGTNGTWTWTSSNTEVLQITSKGENAVINALKAGSATITASYESDTTIGTYTTELITVHKANTTVTAQTAKTLTYNGKEQELVTAGSTNFGKVLYSLDGKTYSESIPKAANAGDYTVYYKVEGTDNWNAVEAQSVTVSIEPKEVSLKWEKVSFTYDGTAKTPSVTAGGLISEDSCDVTVTGGQIKAGSYTATAKSLSNSNYSLPAENTTSFEINKAATTPNTPEQTMDVDYSVKTAGDIALPDDWVLSESDKDKDLVVGINTITAVYTGSDKGNYETESVAIEVTRAECKHTGMVATEAKAPTCVDAGNTAYWYCPECGRYYSDSKGETEIAKDSWIHKVLGHEYGEPIYTWSDDGKTCTAKTICTRKECTDDTEGHTVTETVQSTGKETKAATCEEKGITTYTATFENELFKTQTKEVADIDAKGHRYGITTYTWSEDGKSCTATSVCSNDSTHKITETAIYEPDKADSQIKATVKEAATTEKMGTTTYTATFKNAEMFKVQTKDVVDIPKVEVTDNPSDNPTDKPGDNPSKPTDTTNPTDTTKPSDTTKTDGNTSSNDNTKDTSVTPAPKEEGAKLPVTDTKAEYVVTSKAGEEPAVEYKPASDAADKTVSIPESVTVDGVTYAVNEIADNAFKGNKTVESVVIPKSVKEIGDSAFSGCTKLKSVTIPGSVTEIGDSAFSDCTKLKSVAIPESVTEIGDKAFSGCKKLKSVTIGKNVAEIGDSAFVNCIALKKATLPANVTKLGSNIFKGCKNLKTITVKTTKLTSKDIAKNALKGVGNKVTIKVPKKMKKAYTKLFRKKGLSKKVKIK